MANRKSNRIRHAYSTVIRMGAAFFDVTTTDKTDGTRVTVPLDSLHHDRRTGKLDAAARNQVKGLAETLCSIHGITWGGAKASRRAKEERSAVKALVSDTLDTMALA